MPKTVAQLMISADVGWSFFVSTVMPAAAAVSRALVIWAAVSGCGRLDAASRSSLAWRSSWCTACSVITVLGAEVPGGRAPTSSIFGLATQLPGAHGKLWSDCPGRLAALRADRCAAAELP